MKRSLIIQTAALLIIFAAAAAGGESPRWYSFNEGMDRAKKLKKPILIDFYADWCHWCKVMDRKTFSHQAVSAYLNNNFIAVRIHTDKPNQTISYRSRNYSPREFLSFLGGRGLPALVFMTKEGELITRIPGFVEKEVFFPLLTYIKKECYRKTVPFDKKYISNQGLCR